MNKIFIPNEIICCTKKYDKKTLVSIYKVTKDGSLARTFENEDIKNLDTKNNNFNVLDNFYTHAQDIIRYHTVGEDLEPIVINKYKAEYDNHGFHRLDDTIG